jgi:hypothetical protein
MATATQNQTTDNASASTATVDVKATTTEAAAKANAEADTKDNAEAPAEEPAKAPEVKAEPAKGKTDKLTAKEQLNKQRTKKLEQIKADHSQALESSGHYNDWGFVYAAPAPIANAIGGEIGFMQRNDETMTVQRTGIGIYLRSDHIFDAKLDACTERF